MTVTVTETTTAPAVLRPPRVRPEVERGVALLDERRPGWWRELDLATLDLSDTRSCVVGQLYVRGASDSWDAYRVGLRALGLEDSVDARAHGFDLTSEGWGLDEGRLAEEWRDVVAWRRAC